MNPNPYWGFLKWGWPQIIQVMDDHFSIETSGFGDAPFFQTHLANGAMIIFNGHYQSL